MILVAYERREEDGTGVVVQWVKLLRVALVSHEGMLQAQMLLL